MTDNSPMKSVLTPEEPTDLVVENGIYPARVINAGIYNKARRVNPHWFIHYQLLGMPNHTYLSHFPRYVITRHSKGDPEDTLQNLHRIRVLLRSTGNLVMTPEQIMAVTVEDMGPMFLGKIFQVRMEEQDLSQKGNKPVSKAVAMDRMSLLEGTYQKLEVSAVEAATIREPRR